MSEPETTCKLFASRKTEDIEPPYIPSAQDLKEGSPSNTIPSDIKLCRDSRSSRCAYYLRINKVCDYFKIDAGLCMYHYRNE